MRAWLMVAAVTATMLAFGAPAKIYKWVDDQGQVHYGQQPPIGVDAEPMSVRSAPPSAGSNDTAPSPSPGREDARQGGEAAQSSASAAQADDGVAQNCRTARQNLQVLETAGPGGRYRNPDGEVVRYDEAQWQERVERNRKYVQVFCEEQSR